MTSPLKMDCPKCGMKPLKTAIAVDDDAPGLISADASVIPNAWVCCMECLTWLRITENSSALRIATDAELKALTGIEREHLRAVYEMAKRAKLLRDGGEHGEVPQELRNVVRKMIGPGLEIYMHAFAAAEALEKMTPDAIMGTLQAARSMQRQNDTPHARTLIAILEGELLARGISTKPH